MENLIVTKAVNAFKKGHYQAALEYYKILARTIGDDFFEFNINACNQKILEKGKDSVDSLFYEEKVLLHTNLSLSTIDGSSVFVANVLNVLSEIFSEVHLVCVTEPGENFVNRIKNNSNIKIIKSDKTEVVENIKKLDLLHSYKKIFVRVFGDDLYWFDNSYAKKVIYYWSLRPIPTENDIFIYKNVGTIAFQTDELRQYVFSIIGEKNFIIIPPLLPDRRSVDSDILSYDKIVVSYVGTLRPECYSKDLLFSLLELSKKRSDVVLYLLIGKIFYINYDEKKEILMMLDELRRSPNVFIEEKASSERCDAVIANSDIGFSLWEPTPENSRQISTKFLEYLNFGVNTICFKNDLYLKILGKNYDLFIDEIKELGVVLNKVVEKVAANKVRYKNNYLLSFYSKNAHKLRFIDYFDDDRKYYNSMDLNYFNDQFDKIYGLFINEAEKSNLNYLRNEFNLDISLFEGVNGSESLVEEFLVYKETPFKTEWERRAKKKRLTIGAMGHLFSFIKIARDALSNNYKKILILEADVLVNKNFFQLNSKFRPSDFKVLYYGAGKWSEDKAVVGQHFYRPNKTTGTFAVAFDSSVLEECISEWEKLVDPTDIALQAITDKYQDDCYVFSPNLFIADVSRSNTTSRRSQVQISEKFDWDIEAYHIRSIEYVNKYVEKIDIIFDYVSKDACIKLSESDSLIKIDVSDKRFSINVNRYLKSIEFMNLFVKNIDVF